MSDADRASTTTDRSVQPPMQGVVAVVLRGAEFLVIRRSLTVRAPGAYCFPGGGIEAQEAEADAVRREMQEELGVIAHPVRRIWQCTASISRIPLYWWLTELDAAAEPRPNPAEVHSYYWLDLPRILSLPGLLETNRAFLSAVHMGKVQWDGRAAVVSRDAETRHHGGPGEQNV